MAEAEVWGAWETPAATAARPAAVAPREEAMESVVVVQGVSVERRQEWVVIASLTCVRGARSGGDEEKRDSILDPALCVLGAQQLSQGVVVSL